MQYQTLHLNRKAFTAVFSYYCPSFQEEWGLSFDSSVPWVIPFPCMPRKSCGCVPKGLFPLHPSIGLLPTPTVRITSLRCFLLISFSLTLRDGCHPLPLWILWLLGPWLGKEFSWRKERLVNDPRGTAGIDLWKVMVDSSMDTRMTVTETSPLKSQHSSSGIGGFLGVQAPNCAVGCLTESLDSTH